MPTDDTMMSLADLLARMRTDAAQPGLRHTRLGPTALRELVAHIDALNAEIERLRARLAAAPGRCPHCDDTGTVNSPTGEFRGICTCESGCALKAAPGPAVQELAVRAAVSAIYFADSADYPGALWDVVRALRPDLAELLGRDDRAAWLAVQDEPEQAKPADGCGACRDACRSRGSCRLADESPTMAHEAER